LKTLILGLGKLHKGDEGIGVHAARELLKEDLPNGTQVLEIGTSVLDALPEMEKADRVIVLDAMKYEKEPGTLYRIPHYQSRSSRYIASMHGFDLFSLLALVKRDQPPEVLVIGVEPSHLSWSAELSPQVADALTLLVETVMRETKKNMDSS
jgi:hydrogenase maturation protease